MYKKKKFPFGYIEDLKCRVLELPYRGRELSMLILLPDDIEDESTGLKKVTAPSFTPHVSSRPIHSALCGGGWFCWWKVLGMCLRLLLPFPVLAALLSGGPWTLLLPNLKFSAAVSEQR